MHRRKRNPVSAGQESPDEELVKHYGVVEFGMSQDAGNQGKASSDARLSTPVVLSSKAVPLRLEFYGSDESDKANASEHPSINVVR